MCKVVLAIKLHIRDSMGEGMSFTGEKPLRLVLTTKGFERFPFTSPKPDLDPNLAIRLTEFMAFLQEVEENAAMLRDDQLEQLIERAIVTFGFESVGHASTAMEWLFARPTDLS
jgi:hypothetical protein